MKTSSLNDHPPICLVISPPLAAMLWGISSLSLNIHPSQPPSYQRYQEPSQFLNLKSCVVWVFFFFLILLFPFPVPLSDSLQILLQQLKMNLV